MKKLSEKHKQYLLNKQRRSFRNRKKRKYSVEVVTTPNDMNLSEQYNNTIAFFNKLRQICESTKKHFTIDFKPLRKISPAAALVFTAEIDRIKRIKCFKRLRVIDFKKWNKNISLQLRDMGMFDLLNVNNLPPSFLHERNDSDEYYIRFKAGDIASGEDAMKLQYLLNTLIETTVPNPKGLQKGLTEAMTNSINHAYPEEFILHDPLKQKMWWMSASLNVKTRIMSIMFYDEGIGIPKSLPKTYPEYLKSIGGFLNDDAQMIQAATRINRTSTKQKTRGKGLKDIKDYITESSKGQLKIMSYRGEYNYKSDGSEGIQNRKTALKGTLIQWEVLL